MLKSLLQGLEGNVSIQAEVAAVLCEGQVFFQFLKVTSSSMAPFQPLSFLLPAVVGALIAQMCVCTTGEIQALPTREQMLEGWPAARAENVGTV